MSIINMSITNGRQNITIRDGAKRAIQKKSKKLKSRTYEAVGLREYHGVVTCRRIYKSDMDMDNLITQKSTAENSTWGFNEKKHSN